jgi:hypothetical protein
MITVSRSGGRGPYYQLPMEETVHCSPLCRKMSVVAHYRGMFVVTHFAGNCLLKRRKLLTVSTMWLFQSICKRLRSPGIDSEESILPAYITWRAGTSNRVVVQARQAGNRFLSSLKDLQIRAQLS